MTENTDSESAAQTLSGRIRKLLKPVDVENVGDVETIGDERETIQDVYLEGWNHLEEVNFHFESGVYRIDTSGEQPEFVEVDEDE